VIPRPEGACLIAYRGSVAHGMASPETAADVDLIGVVIAPAEHYLGLTEWGSRGTMELREGRWDCVFYEIRKLFTLLLAGNPNVMSLLWLREEDYLWRSDAGRAILDNRRFFVGKHVYDSFAAYASAQLRKMETRDPAELRRYIEIADQMEKSRASAEELAEMRRFQRKGENLGRLGDKRKQLVLQHGYDAKNAAHCIRLLRMCIEFLATGAMTVYRPDAAELLEIKRGEWPLDRVKAHAAELFEEAKAARDRSTLPDRPDRAGAERLLVRLIREELESTRGLPTGPPS
jgi:uncharacterized protein